MPIHKIASNLLAVIEPASKAITQEEKEAIYKLRYDVFINELKKDKGDDANHDRQWLKDALDDTDHACNFYTGPSQKPTGTLRAVHYKLDQAPENFKNKFSLDLFPELEDEAVGEIGRLVIHPNARGHTILGSLSSAAYHHIVGEMGCRFVFNYCAPGLIRLYRKLGYRPYNGKLIVEKDGLRVPMVFVTSDKDYLSYVRSPLLPLVGKYFGSGKIKPVDMRQFEDRISDSTSHYTVDPKYIWHELQLGIIDAQQSSKPSILSNLNKQDMKILSNKGFLIDVTPGMTVVRQGLVEKEMFVILDGMYEVLDSSNKRIAILGPGEPFGEMALFRDEGVRSATVKALTEGRVLSLRNRFLKELMSTNAELSSKILWNISVFMADRMAKYIK